MTEQPDNLVKQLNAAADTWKRNSYGSDEHLGFFSARDADLCRAAADRIEALAALQRVLREALEPFAEDRFVSGSQMVDAVKRARAALAGDAG